MAHTRRLDPIEERICGALMEKQQTTPDSYPLTVKALVNACNQKSNRDPVMELDEGQVRDALERLRKDVLVWRSSGARVDRWEHRIQSRWHLDDAGLALMTLLLLRGAQTPGELRARSERMHSFASVDQVESTLRDLSEGENALVTELPRQPGQRENRWVHLMAREQQAHSSMVAATVGGGVEAIPAPAPRPASGVAADGAQAGASTSEATSLDSESEQTSVRSQPSDPSETATVMSSKAAVEPDRVRELEERVARLERRLAALEDELGVG